MSQKANAEPPVLSIVAGPNGSGKSSLTAAGLFGDAPVIDPDAVLVELSQADPIAGAVTAGREAIARQTAALDAGQSFVVETTLSGSRQWELIADAGRAGYRVDLYFVTTDTADINVDRVAQRVAGGGHDIPEEDIRRRYDRAMSNIAQAVAVSDRATLLDNSGDALSVVGTLDEHGVAVAETTPPWAFDALREAELLRYDTSSSPEAQTDALQGLTSLAEAMGRLSATEADDMRGRIDAAQNDIDNSLAEKSRGDRSEDEGWGL